MEPRSLRYYGSQETLASMLHIEPSPIDSEDDDQTLLEEDLAGSSSTATSSSLNKSNTSSSLGLSGSGHGAIYYLTRVQRYSSYTFTLFAGIHLANTSIIPLIYRSVPYSEPFLVMAREVYQTPLTEPLLIGLPLLAHIGSGIALRLVRRSQNARRYGHGDGSTDGALAKDGRKHRALPSPWPALSKISVNGYRFAALLAAHVGVNRVVPLLVEGDSSNIGLQYVAHGFARRAAGSGAGVSNAAAHLQGWPFYAALLGFGAGHMVWGWAKWLGLAPPYGWRETTLHDRALRRRRRRAHWAIQGVAAALALTWAAGGLGVVAKAGPATGWLGSVYDGIYAWAGQYLTVDKWGM